MDKKMARRLSILLIVSMLLSAAPLTGIGRLLPSDSLAVQASAAEFREGRYQYTLSGSAATIIKCDTSAYGDVVVPEAFEGGLYPVKAIAQYAFANCSLITSVNLPAGLEVIGNYAFENCSGLKSIGLGGVKTLGQYVFSGCTSLKNITIPKTLVKAEFSWSHEKPVSSFTGSSVENAVFEAGVANIPECIFAQCGTLKSVTIPEKEDTTYGYTVDSYAFFKTGLLSVDLPDSLTYIGAFAFSECAQLASVTIRDHVTAIGQRAFAGCTALETVALGQSLRTIGVNAFENDESLKEILCPASLTSIGNYAFSGCEKLSNVDLNKVSTLGIYAFNGCENLKKIVIPNTLNRCDNTRTGGSAVSSFTGSGIEDAVFEEGIPNIPDCIFAGCYHLKSVSIPERKHDYEGYKIGEYAFSNCYQLSRVTLPDSLTEIGSNAFANCYSLGDFSIPRSVKNFSPNVFNGAGVDIIIPEEDSDNALMLIDNQIPFTAVKTGFEDASDRNLDRAETSYYVSYGPVSPSGYLPVTVKYAFKKDIADDVGNISLTIRMPDEVELVADSVLVNGGPAVYNLSDGVLTCSLGAASGTVTYYVHAEPSARFLSYARLRYLLDGRWINETVGVINLVPDALTIRVPDTVTSRYVTVTGTAAPESRVSITVEGESAGYCYASASGNYTKDVLLPDSDGGTWYKIEAFSGSLQAKEYVFYSPSSPKLSAFTMHYRGNAYDLIALGNKSPLVSWAKDEAFTFVIDFNDCKKVENVCVVSTKGNETVTLNAVYDADDDYYIASGFKGYVPGTLTVTYHEKSSSMYDTAVVKLVGAYTEPDGTKGLKAHIELHDPDNTRFDFIEEVSEGVAFVPTSDYTMTSYQGRTAFVARNPVLLEKDDSCYFVNEIYVRNDNMTCNVVRMGFGLTLDSPEDISTASDAIVTMKELQEQLFALKNVLARKSNASGRNAAFADVRTLLTAAIAKADYDSQKWNDLSALSSDLMNAETSWDIVNAINGGAAALTNAAAVSKEEWPAPEYAEDIVACSDKLSGVIISDAEKTLRNAITEMTPDGKKRTSLMEKALDKDYSDLNTAYNGFAARYSLDTSGYVYEAIPENRLSDVKVTLYYRDENGFVAEWNAEAYDQQNPLLTDNEGNFTFDVPAGEWMLKYEKDGYEDAYSEWMPVPPPHFGLSVGLVSKNAPLVEYINVSKDLVEIKFTQFILVNTVNDGTVIITQDGKTLSGLWEALNTKSVSGSSEVFADRFQYILKDNVSGKVSVTVDGVRNYAGTMMSKPFTLEKTVAPKTKSVVLPAALDEKCKENVTLVVKAVPADSAEGKKAQVSVDNEKLIQLEEKELTFNEKGEAELKFVTLLPGTAVITVTLNDTSITASTSVAISDEFGDCAHDWDDGVITEAATCLETGIKTYTCKKCGQIQTEQIAVLGHNVVVDAAVAPTCGKNGLTEGKHCSICNLVFVAQEKIPAAGEHTFGHWKVSKTATQEKTGEQARICEVCGKAETRVLFRPGDVDNDGMITAGDARLALRGSVQLERYTPVDQEYIAADVDNDGLLESGDARLILRGVVGLEDPAKWEKAVEVSVPTPTDAEKATETDPEKTDDNKPGTATETDPAKTDDNKPGTATETDAPKATETDAEKATETDASKATGTDAETATGTDAEKATGTDAGTIDRGAVGMPARRPIVAVMKKLLSMLRAVI